MISPAAADVAAEVQVDSAPQPAGPLDLGIPLTEWILARLPGPRWLFISFWAAAVLVTPFAQIAAKRLSEPDAHIDSFGELGSQTVLSYVVALLLYGVARLVHDAAALGPAVDVLTVGAARPEATSRWNVAGPVWLSAVVVLVATSQSWSLNGVVPTMIVLLFVALAAVPVMTFVWTYVRLLVGLHRLGRSRLALEPFPQDRSLGLGAVGSLAFGGFILLVGAAVPTLLATTGNPTTFAIALAILGVNIPIFFRSMWRLHRQMSEAKALHVSQARALYAEAYAPLRTETTQSVLRTQAPVLEAARALEERAERIQVWPIDDGLIAIIGFIVAGVASGVVVRFVAIAAHL